MKSVRLAIVVHLIVIALSALWFSRAQSTIDLQHERPSVWHTSYGPGRLLTVTTIESEGASHTDSVTVRWWALGLFLIVTWTAAYLAAGLVERTTRHVLSPLSWLLRGVFVIVVLAFLLSIVISKYSWGYFFRRPAATASIGSLASVDRLSFVQCSFRTSRFHCAPSLEIHSIADILRSCATDSYYCLSGRILEAIRDRGLMRPDLPASTAEEFRHLELLLPSILIASDEGYDANRELRGIMASGATADKRRLLAIGLSGGEVANDHHPYYELLLLQEKGKFVTARNVVFYYDVAGLEGFEWYLILLVLTMIGVTLWIPIGLATAVVVGTKRQRASTSTTSARRLRR